MPRQKYIYKRILETTSEGFWVINADDYKTIEINAALCAMLGYSACEIIGKTPFDFVDENNKNIFLKQIHQIKTTKNRSYEVELTKKDGAKLQTIFNASTVFDKQGKVICAFAMVTDISNEVRIQNELNKINDKLAKSESLIRAILNSQNNLVAVTDGKKIIDANDAFFKFFNIISLEEISQNECFCIWMKLEPSFNKKDDGRCCQNWLNEIERLGWRADIRDKKDGALKNFIVIANPYLGDDALSVVTFTDITKLQSEMNYFIYLASTDTLTGLDNRNKLYEVMDYSIAKSKRYDSSIFCVIMFDIDYFKQVNDTYGHHKGDLVLQSLASLVKKNVRNSDLVARYGGEEFFILAPQINLSQGVIFAEKLRSVIESTPLDGLAITCSFGVCEYDGEQSKTLLIDKVDKLLYDAKKQGRNCVAS